MQQALVAVVKLFNSYHDCFAGWIVQRKAPYKAIGDQTHKLGLPATRHDLVSAVSVE